jgi:hypothetical protein
MWVLAMIVKCNHFNFFEDTNFNAHARTRYFFYKIFLSSFIVTLMTWLCFSSSNPLLGVRFVAKGGQPFPTPRRNKFNK